MNLQKAKSIVNEIMSECQEFDDYRLQDFISSILPDIENSTLAISLITLGEEIYIFINELGLDEDLQINIMNLVDKLSE